MSEKRPFPVYENSELFLTAKVRGVIVKDGKIYLCRLARTGFYCLPGGTLEPGETRREGLRREIVEELGAEPVIGDLVYTQEFGRSSGLTTYDFWYAIENADDYVDVDPSKCTHGFEHDEIGFYDPAEIAGQFKPANLPELLAQWTSGGFRFIQPQ